MRTMDSYRNELEDEEIELLFMSAPLHDIGKVGIPDLILHKPGKLKVEEYEVMKTHPMIGAKALEKTLNPSISEQDGTYLSYARDVILTHHEKWDGSGYPFGLAGDAIPLAGRLMALADVYDALICARVYKPAYPHEKAKEMILKGRGKHFDPDVVDAFLARENEFIDIAAKYAETAQDQS
jgi:putative two-component system response regulator